MEDWATHSALVETARRFLTRNSPVVATEINTTGEAPDAIGWQGGVSVLIEVKASRSDFLNDGKKHFRQRPELGMGNYRHYLAPKGLIKADELPEKWGLLEFDGKRVYRTKEAEHFSDINHAQEKAVLVSLIRRIGQTKPKGVSINAYYIGTNDRTTLSVIDEHVLTEQN